MLHPQLRGARWFVVYTHLGVSQCANILHHNLVLVALSLVVYTRLGVQRNAYEQKYQTQYCSRSTSVVATVRRIVYPHRGAAKRSKEHLHIVHCIAAKM